MAQQLYHLFQLNTSLILPESQPGIVADKVDEKIGVKYNGNRNTGGSGLIKKSAESKKLQKLKGRKLLDSWKNVAAKL